MEVHHWNPETHQYIGSSLADESPLEPGVFLIPAFATLASPSSIVTENHILTWDGDMWKETNIPDLTEPSEKQTPIVSDPMQLLRSERNRLLSDSDWVVIKAYSLGVPVPEPWAMYMQALRDLPLVSLPTLDANGSLDFASVTWPITPSS
jgi:hypothetical protein